MGDTLIDLTGNRFGGWFVLKRAPNRGKAVMWECLCDCGTTSVVQGTSLKSGASTNCGCGRIKNHYRTHGLTKHPLYRVWQRIKGCTSSPSHQDYAHYGGRGIQMCVDWQNDFQSFYDWCMSHGWEKGLEIDRIDTNGNYEPSNCRFTDRVGQMSNTRKTRLVTYNGKTQSVAQWARETGLKVNTLYGRLKNGWSVEKALTTEVHHANRCG